ncbi:hypothetical protein FACS1894111_09160 [Clostridia bacterium]|nr:hypothetical protein FACS1894111_09160 [Clostridia bacterium]
MKTDLIERYIYAVARHLPSKLRSDVEKELDSLIADMLTERCGDVLPTEKDIRIVLTELGMPEELAAKYSGEENKALISGHYFLQYKQILTIVLPIIAAVTLISSIIQVFAEWGKESAYDLIFQKVIVQTIGGAIGGVVWAFAVITIIFAVVERKKWKVDDGDIDLDLPPLPKNKAEIKKHEVIIGMVFSVIGTIVFLGFTRIFAVKIALDGGWIPIFDSLVIRQFWIFFILAMVLSIVKESLKLIDGRYTKRIVIVTILCNVIAGIGAVIVFWNGNILNSEFVNQMKIVLGENAQNAFGFFHNFNRFLLGMIFLVMICESIGVAWKAWKYNKD